MPSERPGRALIHRRPVPAAIPWSTPHAWLASLAAVFAALMAVPSAVSGATPPGTTGGSGDIPLPSLLDQLLGIVVPIALIAIAIAILSGLAFLVARIGGPPVSAEPGLAAEPPHAPTSATGRVVLVVVAIGAAGAGILVGREIAYEQSVGMFLAGMVATFFLGVAVVGLGLIGLIAAIVRRGHISVAIATVLAAAGLLATGAIGGRMTASLFGGTYRAPVVLSAPGTATVAMTTSVGPFAPSEGGAATCESVADGRSVGAITALSLGRLGAGTLRGTLRMPAGTPDGATVEFFIDGGSLSDGAYQPFWSGPVAISGVDSVKLTGIATFAGLQREGDPSAVKAGSDPGSNAGSAAPGGWPETLSGTLRWTCRPW